MLFVAYTIGSVHRIVGRMQSSNNELRAKLMGVEQFMNHHSLPRELKDKVAQYYAVRCWLSVCGILCSMTVALDCLTRARTCPRVSVVCVCGCLCQFLHEVSGGRGQEEEALTQLPRCVRFEISYSIMADTVRQVPLFRGVPDSLIRSLVRLLQPIVVVAGQVVVEVGTYVDMLYIVHWGRLETVSPPPKIGERQRRRMGVHALSKIASRYLDAGAYFGQMDHSSPSLVTVQAVTFCHLYIISTGTLRKLLKAFPEANETFILNQAVASRGNSMMVGGAVSGRAPLGPLGSGVGGAPHHTRLRRFVSTFVAAVPSRQAGDVPSQSHKAPGSKYSSSSSSNTSHGHNGRGGGGGIGGGHGDARVRPTLAGVPELHQALGSDTSSPNRQRRYSHFTSARNHAKTSLRWWTDGGGTGVTSLPLSTVASLRSIVGEDAPESELPFVVHPRSVLHKMRLLVSATAVMYYAFTVPSRLVFYTSPPHWGLVALDWLLDVAMVGTMVVNMRTAYIFHGTLVVDPQDIAVRYLSSTFFLDLAATFPFDLLWVRGRQESAAWALLLLFFLCVFLVSLFARRSSTEHAVSCCLVQIFLDWSPWFRINRMIRVLRLNAWFEDLIMHTRYYIQLRVCKLIGLLSLAYHFAACTYFVFVRMDGYVRRVCLGACV